MAPEFESHQTSCWSADKYDVQSDFTSGYWIVNFKQGQILQALFLKPSVTSKFPSYSPKNETNYVKAVRLVK